MRETLIVRLLPESQAEWLLRAAPGEETSSGAAPQRGELDELIGQASNRRVILLVPGEDVLLTHVNIAVRQSAKLLQAAPYALEEQLAQDVDTLHFSAGSRQSDGRTPVAVVARERMDEWLAPFHAAGLQPDLMLPEPLALPDAGGSAVVLAEESRCTIKLGEWTGFVCEPAALADLLQIALPAPEGDEHSPGVALISTPGAGALPNSIALARSQQVDTAIEAMRDAGESSRLNLLQGAYAPRRATDQWLKALRLPAAAAAAWLLLATGSMAIANLTLGNESERLWAMAEDTFKSAFPKITRIVDLRAQAEQQMRVLRGGGEDSGFLYLLAESGKAVAGVDGLQLDGVQYRDESLYLSLSGSDIQALDVLRSKFKDVASLKLDVQSANSSSDGVQIRLKVDSL